MAKKVRAVIKLQLEAGKATPAPPVGPALGQHGVNIMAFVKEYNDRSFTFVTRTPPASDLLRRAAGIEKGQGDARTPIGATISNDLLRSIAEDKMKDLNANSVDQAMNIIAGTARSMGIAIEGD